MFKGGSKNMESLWQVIVGTWHMLRTHLGHIRVDFAQPFSPQVAKYCNNIVELLLTGIPE